MDTGLSASELEAMVRVFAAHPNVERVILFGSRARGDHRPGSDVDLCLEGDELEHTELIRIAAELDDLELPYRVEPVLRRHVSHESLLERIDREGVVIHGETEAERVP